MTNIEISYDKVTGYFDASILSLGIATQAKSLDECVKHLSEALSLSQNKSISLEKFNISCEELYVNS